MQNPDFCSIFENAITDRLSGSMEAKYVFSQGKKVYIHIDANNKYELPRSEGLFFEEFIKQKTWRKLDKICISLQNINEIWKVPVFPFIYLSCKKTTVSEKFDYMRKSD